MIGKRKALGLGLFAWLALGAFSLMPASAIEGGKFDVEFPATVKGTESGTHTTTLSALSGSLDVTCTNLAYQGESETLNPSTIGLVPAFVNCYNGSHVAGNEVTVSLNECRYKFNVRTGNVETEHNTFGIECKDLSKRMEFHIKSGGMQICTLTVAHQTATGGVLYKTDTLNKIHTLTFVLTATLKTEQHGLCALFGTNGTVTLSGSMTVHATRANGTQIPITATNFS